MLGNGELDTGEAVGCRGGRLAAFVRLGVGLDTQKVAKSYVYFHFSSYRLWCWEHGVSRFECVQRIAYIFFFWLAALAALMPESCGVILRKDPASKDSFLRRQV